MTALSYTNELGSVSITHSLMMVWHCKTSTTWKQSSKNALWDTFCVFIT